MMCQVHCKSYVDNKVNNVHLIRSLSRAYIYIISMRCIILIDIL